jgi:Flp pilus assembly protein TadD
MKICRVCGTRNRPKYEDCVRCGEPLPVATGGKGKEGSGVARLPAAVKLAIVMVAVLGVMVVSFRWLASGSSEEISADLNSEGARPLDDALVDDALAVPAESEIDPGAFGEAAEATRNGKAAFRAGNFEEALQYFEDLLHTSPSNHTGHLFVGLCKQKLGDITGATASLRQAIGIKPNDQLTRKALIKLLVDTDELQEAGELQGWFVKNKPFDAQARVDLARIYRQNGEVDLAIAELERAAELAPTSQEPKLELGTALIEASRSDEAVEVFEQIATDNPRDPRAHAGIGAAFVSEQRYKDAVSPLEKAAALDPKQPNVRLNLAIAYENLDRIEDSLREYDAFVKLAPNDPSAARIAELVERAKAALAERQTN